jgi:hypothetical protein
MKINMKIKKKCAQELAAAGVKSLFMGGRFWTDNAMEPPTPGIPR